VGLMIFEDVTVVDGNSDYQKGHLGLLLTNEDVTVMDENADYQKGIWGQPS